MEKFNYPMPRKFCGAKTRHGTRCRQPAMRNGKCRLHGGKSLSGKAHGRYRHGLFTKEAIEQKKTVSALLKAVKELILPIENFG